MTESPIPQGDGTAGDADDGTPVWLHDFPHTSSGEDAVTRRAFTRYLIAGSGVFAACTVGAAAWTSLRELHDGEETAVIAVEDLPEGAAHLFRYPGPDDPAVLVRIGEDEFVAYSQKCTHLGCVVYYDDGGSELICPCHEGVFEVTTGDPIAGPPERPLPSIAVEVRDGTVWALGIRR